VIKLKKEDRIKLVGLLALAPQHNRALRDIERAICDIVKVEKYGDAGHVCDAIYSEYDVDTLLDKLAAAEKRKTKGA
jgi:hypothetical protein